MHEATHPAGERGLPAPVRALADAGCLMPGLGPLLRAGRGAPSSAGRTLVDAWRAGALVRVVTGVYVGAAWWSGLKPWDRVGVAAAGWAARHPDAVLTGATAAHLHGLPLVRTPAELEVRAASGGHRGRRPLVTAALARPGLAPEPPGLRERWNVPRSPADEGPVEVRPRLSDGTVLVPVRLDPPCTVQLLLGAELPFAEAAAPLDALASAHPAPSDRWAAANRQAWPTRAGRERVARAWDFADPRAESAGESLSRALIEELGFVRPVLQRVLHDARGRFVARADFWWEEAGVVGEFDGVGKYDIDLHGSEAERRRSIRREAERGRRLREVSREQVHWTWDDLRRPERLAAELTRAGVPRRR